MLLERELKALCDLAHPNMVCLHGYCFTRTEQVLVYELAQGGTLDDLLKVQCNSHNSQYGTVECLRLQSSPVQYSTSTYRTGQYSTVQYCTAMPPWGAGAWWWQGGGRVWVHPAPKAAHPAGIRSS